MPDRCRSRTTLNEIDPKIDKAGRKDGEAARQPVRLAVAFWGPVLGTGSASNAMGRWRRTEPGSQRDDAGAVLFGEHPDQLGGKFAPSAKARCELARARGDGSVYELASQKGAVETVTSKIPSTIEAAALCKMAEPGHRGYSTDSNRSPPSR
jgi:hypothetical protein